MRKICVVTGTRAEFGLLYWLMDEIKKDPELELQVIATGMHLSPEFGLTYQQIEESGIKLTKKVEILLSSDTPIGISKSMGLGMISFAEAYEELQPDLLVVLGDRFEIFSAASAAMICRIPVAHIHGGEATEGLIDEPIRHSVSKMSHLHFTATEEYRKRVIQLGESPDRVYNTGAPGLDNIEKLTLLSKEELEAELNFDFGKRSVLVTYHPVTLEKSTSKDQFHELLKAIQGLKDVNIIFTMPNADTDGRVIQQMIEEYTKDHPSTTKAFKSLGQLRYLSSLQYVDCVIGNSSSGLIEVPTFKIPTINIGERQKGRIKASSVIDCEPNFTSIKNALKLALSEHFRESLLNIENPYGRSGSSLKIKNILKEASLENILKKEFYDIKF